MTVTDAIELDGESPVVLYRFYNADSALLYVGITSDPAARFGAHQRNKPWWPDVARRTAALCSTRAEALKAEETAIRDERPVHNIQFATGLRALPQATPAPQQAEPDDSGWNRDVAHFLRLSEENDVLNDEVHALAQALSASQRKLRQAVCPHPANRISPRMGICTKCDDVVYHDRIAQ